MNLCSAGALALALIPFCASHLINIPVSQVGRPVWNLKTVVPRPQWKSKIQRLSQPVRLPKQSLTKQSRRSQQPARAFRLLPNWCPPRRKAVKLTNYKDKIYHLPIEIGTPGQKFNMALYTSYSAIWVPSVHYSFSRIPRIRKLFEMEDEMLRYIYPYRRYNNASSSTYIANGKKFREYFDANQGYWSQDRVTVAGLTVKNQFFGEVLLTYDLFKYMNIDGVFGLMPTGSATDEGPTVFENMINQCLLPVPAFSLYLNRFNSNGRDSMLIFGGADRDYYTGRLIFTPLVSSYRWQFKMDGVEVSNRSQFVIGGRDEAELDTSTPLIHGPMEEIQILHFFLGGKMHKKLPGRFIFDCSKVNTLPDVGFIVNGYSLLLSSKDFIIKEDEDGKITCFSAIAGLYWRRYNMSAWIFGSSFMRAYYTYFDKGNSRVGFARAID